MGLTWTLPAQNSPQRRSQLVLLPLLLLSLLRDVGSRANSRRHFLRGGGRGRRRLAWQLAALFKQPAGDQVSLPPFSEQTATMAVKHPCEKTPSSLSGFSPLRSLPPRRFPVAVSGKDTTTHTKKNLCLQHLIRGDDGNQPRLRQRQRKQEEGDEKRGISYLLK